MTSEQSDRNRDVVSQTLRGLIALAQEELIATRVRWIVETAHPYSDTDVDLQKAHAVFDGLVGALARYIANGDDPREPTMHSEARRRVAAALGE